MAFGIEISDQIGKMTALDSRTLRIVSIVTVSSVNGSTYNIPLTNVDYDGDPFMHFVANSGANANGVYWPGFTYNASQATIMGRGIAGTAYVGVT